MGQPALRFERGDVLLRTRAALTCGTDAKVFRRGYHAKMIVPPAAARIGVPGGASMSTPSCMRPQRQPKPLVTTPLVGQTKPLVGDALAELDRHGLVFIDGNLCVALALPPDGSGLWPLVGARASSLVMLVVIILSLTRLRPEAVLGIAFLGGLTVDLLGSSVLGLRAMVFTIVAYLALRTRERADLGRVVIGLWVGMLTLGGVLLLLIVGTLFGQPVLLGDGVVGLLLLVPTANTILAWIFAPMVVRFIDRDTTAFRYA